MVASKKIHCVVCNKKCSGNVLRYQDQYYHRQCFEVDHQIGTSETTSSKNQQSQSYVDQQQQQNLDTSNERDDNYYVENKDSHQLSQPYQSHQHHFQNQTYEIQHNDDPLRDHHQLMNSSASASQSHLPSTTTSTKRDSILKIGHRASSSNMSLSNQQKQLKSQTIDARNRHQNLIESTEAGPRSATLPHSVSSPANGFLQSPDHRSFTSCAGCKENIKDGQALIALDLHWHVWCFKCTQCQAPLHGEYVAKDGRAYCEKDYQKLYGITCVYCKRFITGKVLQAGEAHHFHPSCARCSKCGDPFVPGEEMYLQGEVTWHPRCGPGPDSAGPLDELILDSSSRSQVSKDRCNIDRSNRMHIPTDTHLAPACNHMYQLRATRAQSPSLSSRSRSRSASPFSFMSRQYAGRSSPGYADSEAVGDLSRIYTISYLNADPAQGYLRRPIEPNPPKSPQFSRPTSSTRDRSRSSSRSAQFYSRERSVPKGMYSVLSSMRSGSSHRARSPSMMNEEAIHLAQYPSGQKPSPDTIPKIERDDFPAPPFPYHPERRVGGGQEAATNQTSEGIVERQQKQQQQQQQQRASRPRSREIVIDDDDSSNDDPQLKKEEEELSKIANGIGKIFLQTLKEREKLRAWKRNNLDPRNASRTPSATRELPNRLRYDNPTNASPSRDMDRLRPWEEDDALDHSPTRTRSSLGKPSQMSSSTYGYKVVQSNRSTPKPGYGVTNGSYEPSTTYSKNNLQASEISYIQQQKNAQNRSADLLNRAHLHQSEIGKPPSSIRQSNHQQTFGSPHLRRSMPNVNSLHHIHNEGPPKLYPYHLLATSNYRLPPDVDRCHLERHLSNEEFQYIFHCDRLDFYRLPEWKRNELKRRAKLF